MFLGIEIGGTKTQLGISGGPGTELIELIRLEVDRLGRGEGIRQQIVQEGGRLLRRHPVRAVGVGFGGPTDARGGVTLISHQVEGWDRFPLRQFLQDAWHLPVSLGNDCDTAALAEAVEGAGRGSRVVLFVTAGTGVGGGLVINGQLVGQDQPAAAEIGHLRPGIGFRDPSATVESLASGPGIAATAAALMAAAIEDPWQRRGAEEWSAWEQAARRRADRCADTRRLLHRCEGRLRQLTSRDVALEAGGGNALASWALSAAAVTLGWAIAQAITLVAPQTVVVGGGVSLMDHTLFLDPLRNAVAEFVFPQLAHSFQIVPPELGEAVVVRGAVLLAQAAADQAH